MPAGGYLVGTSTLAAGLLLVLQPKDANHVQSVEDTPQSFFSNILAKLTQWFTQPSPNESYANLPLFGVTPDVKLRVAHRFLRSQGFHYRYRLDIEIYPQFNKNDFSLEGCDIVAEWSVPKDLIIDQWLLHRSLSENGYLRWSFGGVKVDLEAPVYSAAAKDFTLTGLHAVEPGEEVKRLSIEIPDIMPRYQLPSYSSTRSPSIVFPAPQVRLMCPKREGNLLFRVEAIDSNGFGPLVLNVPVAIPYAAVDYGTFSLVFLSIFYLLFRLYKA